MTTELAAYYLWVRRYRKQNISDALTVATWLEAERSLYIR